MPFLTPDYMPGVTTWHISIPDYLISRIIGMFVDASEVDQWEAWGDRSPEDCAYDVSQIAISFVSEIEQEPTRFEDDFNRADENPLVGDGHWKYPVIPDMEAFILDDFSIHAENSNSQASMYRDVIYGADQDIALTIVGTTGSAPIAMFTRLIQPGLSGVSGYYAYFDLQAGSSAIWRIDSAEDQTLLIDVGVAPGIGDRARFSSIEDEHTIWYWDQGEWHVLLSVTDDTYLGPGMVGILSVTQVNVLDDVEGGEV